MHNVGSPADLDYKLTQEVEKLLFAGVFSIIFEELKMN